MQQVRLDLFYKLLALSFATGLYSSASIADQPLSAVYQTCIACHGNKAQGNPALSAPALAGQEAWYLASQLNNFRNGLRGADSKDSFGAQMTAISKSLSLEQIDALSKELNRLTPHSRPSFKDGDVEKGKKIFQSNCAACHAGDAQGNEQLNSPSLKIQDGPYMVRQLKNFKAGIRGNHADDKYGRQMALMANTLTDEQAMQDVVAYILTL